jgi:hypothetical protein
MKMTLVVIVKGAMSQPRRCEDVRLLRGLAGFVGKLLYGARDESMLSPFYLDLLTLRIIGVISQCVHNHTMKPERIEELNTVTQNISYYVDKASLTYVYIPFKTFQRY